MLRRIALIGALAFVSFASFAGQAPWYKWRSQLDSQITCAQFTPGDSWVRLDGPYDNPGCR